MKEESKIECPVCGSSQVDVLAGQSTIQAPYGPHVAYADNVWHCKTCGTDVDHSRVFENSDKLALEKSVTESIEKMIASLGDEGFTLAYMERALSLPQRTISRWKTNGDLSKIGITLLRVIRTYPWILKVAENKFDTTISKRILVENGVKEFLHYFSPSAPVSLNQIGILKDVVSTNSEGPTNFTFWAKGMIDSTNKVSNNEGVFISTQNMVEV